MNANTKAMHEADLRQRYLSMSRPHRNGVYAYIHEDGERESGPDEAALSMATSSGEDNGSLDTHSHASLECNLSNSDSLNESSSDVASNCTARSVRSRRSRSADSCGEPDGSGTSDYSSPPALDYDDETISNTSSCDDEDMEATDPLSINDESLGSRHRAYPRNLIDDGRDSHLNSLRPALDELATLPDDSETGSHSLDRFVKTQDDQWNVLSSRSSLLSDTSDNRALDILTELLDAVDAAFDATKH